MNTQRPDIGRLFDQHARSVRSAVYALTGSREVADDIVQEVFLSAWKRQHELVDGPAMKGWLYRTAYHLVQHHWRGTRRFKGALDRVASAPQPTSSDPEAHAERRQRGEQVRACIATLPVAYREVFVLSGTGDFEGPEIAKILDIPLNTVWTRLFRARKAFQERWGSGPDTPGARPEASFDTAALWAWLVAWLPPEVVPTIGGERRLVERLAEHCGRLDRPVDLVLRELRSLPEDHRAELVLFQILQLPRRTVAEILDQPLEAR